jgi:acetolactate synthase I/II/III large subunit
MVQERLPAAVLVADNGNVRHDPHAPGAPVPQAGDRADLVNPNFAALARAYDAHGERLERPEGFPDAFARARAAGGSALIELITDPEALTPAASLSETRARAKAAR